MSIVTNDVLMTALSSEAVLKVLRSEVKKVIDDQIEEEVASAVASLTGLTQTEVSAEAEDTGKTAETTEEADDGKGADADSAAVQQTVDAAEGEATAGAEVSGAEASGAAADEDGEQAVVASQAAGAETAAQKESV